MALTSQDRVFLKALQIQQDDDIVPDRDMTNHQYQEVQHWETDNGRDPDGHPIVNTLQYRQASADRRALAVRGRYEDHMKGARCRCGALFPSACCYL